MKKLVNLLNNRWVLGIVGIAALSAVIWFGADYVKFGANNESLSTTTRLIIIGVIFLTWLIWSLIRWGLEQRQTQQMVEEIEAEETASAVDPDEERSAEEIKLISERFKEALTTLKKTRFKSESGSKTLYQLPWYIIIGPPGAGKTTALVNSGLNFPLANSHGAGALGGIGGTRHCDWWFTNDAVLIDTAGRYTTQDSHRVVDNKGWGSFLKMLKKYRPRRPINGAIIAISLQELMVQTADQRLHHAKTIRSRIDELQQELGINFPVYIMFTKGDMVAGFSEFFANLSQAEREQVWGMTFPIEKDQNAAALFEQEYQQLIQRLNQRLLWRIDSERNIDARALMQGFPNRMDALQANLKDFIAATFAPNNYNASPLLRGIYFSSATQEGSPIDRMMAAVSANFGLPRSVTASQSGSGKSFFLNRLMTDIVFAESELVGTNQKIENLLRWGRRISFAAMGIAAVAMTAVWASTVVQNRGYMSEVMAATDNFESAKKEARSTRNMQSVLTLLNPLRSASQVYDQEQHPWLSGIGLYDGRVDEAAKKLYRQNLDELYLPAFTTSMERQIGKLTAENPELPNTLGTYIMLSDKSHQDNEVIVSWAEQQWQKKFMGKAETQNQLMDHLQSLLAEPLPSSTPNPRVIKRARQQLSRIPMSQRLYKQLQRGYQEPVDLYQKIGGDSEMIFGISADNRVFSTPLLYTKAGFDDADYSPNSDLIDKLESDSWIYGDVDTSQYGEAERKALSQQIERAYLSDYARRWEKFMKELNIAPFNNLDGAVESLQLLADPSYSPLLTTLELATENTQLRPALATKASEGSLGGIVPDSMKPTSVDKEFRDLHRLTQEINNRPAAVQGALEAISELRDFMDGINSEGNPGESAYKVAKARFNGSGSNPIQKVRKLATRSPEPLKHWMEQIADHSWKVVLAESSRYVSDEWNQQVYYAYQDSLSGRYPLSANANNETPLSDFNKFMGPNGIEDTFFKEYLTTFIDTRKWQLKQVDGRSLSISNDAMQQLKRARNLRATYYSGSQMVFKFSLTPTKLDSGVKRFTLELANTRISYSHGPQIRKNATWTGGDDDRVRLLFEDLNGDTHREQYTGDWAWLKLFDSANLKRGSNASKYDATFSVGSRKAQYRLSSKTSATPFNTGLLRSYRCPQTL